MEEKDMNILQKSFKKINEKYVKPMFINKTESEMTGVKNWII